MLRNKKTLKTIAVFILINILADVCTPAILAATASVKRVNGISAGSADMVDIRTGDFFYNVPLMEVPGPDGSCPINLSYKSGITNDQDASWVGLGWNLEVGSISRTIKGFADDYNGANVNISNTGNPSSDLWSPLASYQAGSYSVQYFGMLNAKNATAPAANITTGRSMDYMLLSDLSSPDFTFYENYFGDADIMNGGLLPAYDQYSISGPGISGEIEPVVLENGSVFGLKRSDRDYIIQKKYTQDKQFFRFKNEFSNSFTVQPSHFGTSGGAFTYPLLSNNLAYTYKGPDETGYNESTMRLAGSRHINYFTNTEITSGSAKTTGFINTVELLGQNRSSVSFTTREPTPKTFASNVSAQIGGFSVTNENGITYHYALPVYTYGQKTSFADKNGTKLRVIQNDQAYAHSWLLTTITGSDFVDTNNNGAADEGDAGAWTNFNYGKVYHDFILRTPYTGTMKSSDNSNVWSASYKEVYYLDAVYTRSHTALFSKELRSDAAGAVDFDNGGLNINQIDATIVNTGIKYSKFPMKLKSVHLYKNEDIIAMSSRSSTNPSTYTKSIARCIAEIKKISSNNIAYNLWKDIIDPGDLFISGPAGSTIANPEYELKRIALNTDNTLSTGMPNTLSSLGRLTLKSVQFLGQMGIQEKPSVDFQYDIQAPTTEPIWLTNVYGNAGWTELRLGRIYLSGSAQFQLGDIITFKNSNTQKTYHCTLTRKLNPNEYDVRFLGNNIPVGNPDPNISETKYLAGVTATKTKNPPYTKNFRDNWGYFKSDYLYRCGNDNGSIIDTSGIENFDRRTNTLSSKSVDVWSLRRITTSLGSFIDVEYESDMHSNQTDATVIGKSRAKGILNSTSVSYSGGIYQFNIKESIDGAEEFAIGQVVKIETTVTAQNTHEGIGTFKITQISSGYAGIPYIKGYFIDPNNNPIVSYPGGFHNGSHIIYEPAQKYGGGIRTKKIKETIDGNYYETAYEYLKVNGKASGMTASEPLNLAGVASLDASVIEGADNPLPPDAYWNFHKRRYFSKYVFFGFYNQMALGYFNPNVIYERVIKRQYGNGIQSPTYEEYRYKVFSDDMLTKNRLYSGIGNCFTIKITNKTSQIGNLLNHKVYDLFDNILKEEKYTYTDGAAKNNQGIIEQVFHLNKTGNSGSGGIVTVKSDWSTAPASVEYKDYVKGTSSRIDYLSYDFYTGQVIQTSSTDAYGNTILQSSVPAYHIYTAKPSIGAEMGLRVKNNLNRNMLSQIAASYVVKPSNLPAINCSISSVVSSSGSAAPKLVVSLPYVSLAGEYVVNTAVGMTYTLNGVSTYGLVYISSIAADRNTFECYLPDVPAGASIGSTAIINVNANPLISASIQTWNNKWTYRKYNQATNVYDNEVILEASPAAYYDYKCIWNPSSGYIWNSPEIETDGTYKNYQQFNWITQKAGSAQSSFYWQKQSQITYRDKFSNSIELKDVNGNYAATKMAYDQNYILRSSGTTFAYPDAIYLNKTLSAGTNTNLASFAFAGFEGLYKPTGGSLQFSGENPAISSGNAFKQTPGIKAHSGNYMFLLPNGGESTLFQVQYKTANAEGNILPGKKYRASVWVHNLSDESAGMIVTVRGNSSAIYTSASIHKSSPSSIIVGDWTLLVLDFDVPANYTSTGANDYIKVTVGSAEPVPCYFDDFAVRPIDANMNSFVYDEQTGAVLYIIDKDNFYTRFQYDKTGRMVAAYKETLTGEKKVSTYDYNFAKQ